MSDLSINNPHVVALPEQGTPTAEGTEAVAPKPLTAGEVDALWKDVYTRAHEPIKSYHKGKEGHMVPMYTFWDDAHIRLVDPNIPLRDRNEVFIITNDKPNIPVITGSFINGREYVVGHGGSYIFWLLQLNRGNWSATFQFRRRNPWNEKLYPGVDKMQLQTIFDAERKLLKTPEPGIFPEMSVYAARDVFCLLKVWLNYVPQAEWATEWKNYRGDVLTFNRMMAAAMAVYVDPRTGIDGSSSHDHLHMPELLLRYHSIRGDTNLLRPVQQAFLQRELAFPINRMWSVNNDKMSKIFHYVETLGAMLDHPGLQWDENDRLRVQGWLSQLKEFITENRYWFGSGVNSEVGHYYRGMQLIAKNAAKIFP